VGASQVGNATAYKILAGVPPMHGLNATMVGTPVGALTASSQFLAVVLRLRGRGTLLSTAIALIRGYAAELAAGGGRLYLAGVGQELKDQPEHTGPEPSSARPA